MKQRTKRELRLIAMMLLGPLIFLCAIAHIIGFLVWDYVRQEARMMGMDDKEE